MAFQYVRPASELSRSWMANDGLVHRLDESVRTQLTTRLAILEGAGAAANRSSQSVQLLVEDLRAGVRHGTGYAVATGRHPRWFVGTCACALLGELIYVAGAARANSTWIYKIPDIRSGPRDSSHEPLQLLRNACFHPGDISSTSSLRLLAAHIESRYDRDLGRALTRDPVLLRERHVLAWSIRQIDEVGHQELRKLPTPET
jgi:hypothetical protein